MSKSLINIKNICKSFFDKKKEKKALYKVSFDLKEGEVFGLLGVNGAGKTTLSSIIATLIKPTDGDILWQGRSIYKNYLDYRKIIGFCPQKQNIDTELSIEKNLDFQGRFYALDNNEIIKRKNYLLEKFDLKKYAKQKADVLSGGYRQRFLIARALMHSPKLVILDEPTVGLDPQVRRKLWHYISLLKKENVTVLLTTHYLDEAEILSDRVCVIDEGKVLVVDTPDQLKKDLKKTNLEDVFLQIVKQGEK
jgi:ABC-2 type transport system ATP-binding protein